VIWQVLAASRLVTFYKCPELPSLAAECMDQTLCWNLCKSYIPVNEYSVSEWIYTYYGSSPLQFTHSVYQSSKTGETPWLSCPAVAANQSQLFIWN